MSSTRRPTGPGDEKAQLPAAEENAEASHPRVSASDEASQGQRRSIHDDLAQSIANVLRAAEEESAQLVSAAEADAQAIRENAEAETSDLRGRLESELADRRQQLTVLRDEVERYADERRREADLEASRIRAEAEAEVSTRREELDAVKQKLEEHRRRWQELIDASRALEHWLSGTVSTFRDVVVKLETVLEAPPAELDQTLLQGAQSVADDVDLSGVDIREALAAHADTEQSTPARGETLVKRADADDWVPLDSE